MSEAQSPPNGPSRRPLDAPFKSERRVQIIAMAGLAAYLLFTYVLTGLRVEHGVLAAAFAGFTLVGGRALRFLILFLPIALTGASYDLFRVATSLRGEIHVADLHGAELALFGIDGQVPALWFASRTHAVVDFITGVSYIVYLYVPMVAAVVLYFRDQERMKLVGWSFFLTNVVGMVVYIAYPAAPPWYVADYGLGPAVLDALPSAAGASRFDALIGVPFFENFYSRSANVFGAMPSLHVAYPTSTLLALWSKGRVRGVLVAFVAVVSFAAVYLQHHYLLDVIAGLLCAASGYALARRFLVGQSLSFSEAREPTEEAVRA